MLLIPPPAAAQTALIGWGELSVWRPLRQQWASTLLLHPLITPRQSTVTKTWVHKLHKYWTLRPVPYWTGLDITAALTWSLTLSCRSSSRSLMMSCRSSAGIRSAGQAVSSVSTRLLQDCSACRFALRLRRTRLRSTTCCRIEFTSYGKVNSNGTELQLSAKITGRQFVSFTHFH